MAEHGCLKNEFTEDEKYHNLMSWFKHKENQWLRKPNQQGGLNFIWTFILILYFVL